MNPTQEEINAEVKKNQKTLRELTAALRKGIPYPRAKFFMNDNALCYGWVKARGTGWAKGMWVDIAQADDTDGEIGKRILSRISKVMNMQPSVAESK
jgi:hypothetical protein